MKKLGIAVVNISLITDYDAGVLEGTEAVSAHDVLEVFAANAERIQGVVLDLIGRFPADLDGLGARAALGPTRGDGHTIAPEDIRLFVEKTLTIGIGLLSSVVTLGSFVVILWMLSAAATLPHLIASEAGDFVSLASVAGVRAFPGEAVYNASKSFVQSKCLERAAP